MVAGDAANSDNSKVSAGNICHRCWTNSNDDTFVGGAPCSGTDTVAIPIAANCQMIRQTIIFPAYVSLNVFFLFNDLQNNLVAGMEGISIVQTTRVTLLIQELEQLVVALVLPLIP